MLECVVCVTAIDAEIGIGGTGFKICMNLFPSLLTLVFRIF